MYEARKRLKNGNIEMSYLQDQYEELRLQELKKYDIIDDKYDCDLIEEEDHGK